MSGELRPGLPLPIMVIGDDPPNFVNFDRITIFSMRVLEMLRPFDINFRPQRLFVFAAVSLLFFADVARLSAQNTPVAELSKPEAEKAMQLYKELQDARKQWQDFKDAMRYKYGTELVQSLHLSGMQVTHLIESAGGGANKEVLLPVDWGQGVDFSSNFKFIVPANNQQTCSSR